MASVTLTPGILHPLAATLPQSGAALAFDGLPGADAAGFQGALFRALDDARQRDVVAQQAVEAFARGDDQGRLHETMLALSKAEISLRTVASVRSKLVDAYRELLHVTT